MEPTRQAGATAVNKDGTRRGRLAGACVGGVLSLLAAGCSGTVANGTASTTTTSPTTPEPASTMPPPPPPSTSASPPPSLGALTTYDYGNARSGTDTVDPPITALSSAPKWNESLGAAVYGQPLVYDATVYVGTENDTIYAIGATTGKVLWSLRVGDAVNTSVIDSTPTLSGGCGDISPLGITGTPVIDTAANEMFVAEETEVGTDNWQDVQHWLVAVSLSTHTEIWHRQIDPPGGNDANDYYIPAEQQRSALTLLGGRIYVEFGGLDGDCGQYHGYVVDLAESGRGSLVSYQIPTGREGGIWGTGGAFVSSAGDLYIATGNGSSNSLSDYDEGNSVVELSPALMRVGYWAPSDWVQLNDDDWDLGSAGPVAIPGTSLFFVAGKPAAKGSFGDLMEDSPLGGIGHGRVHGTVVPGGRNIRCIRCGRRRCPRHRRHQPYLRLRALRGRYRSSGDRRPGNDVQEGVVPFSRHPERIPDRRGRPGLGPQLARRESLWDESVDWPGRSAALDGHRRALCHAGRR